MGQNSFLYNMIHLPVYLKKIVYINSLNVEDLMKCQVIIGVP